MVGATMRRGGAIGLVALVVSALVWAVVPPPPAGATTAATGVTATASPTVSNTVDVSWTAPSADPGGQTFSGYNVYTFDATNAQVKVSSIPGSKTTTQLAVDGLTNGAAYTFRVDSIYSGGTVVASATSSAATPYGVPDQTTFSTVTAGDRQVILEWAAAAANGSAVTDYVVTNRVTNATVSVGPVLSTTVSGLTNGVAITFQVTAYNARGASSVSAVSAEVTPVGSPVAPTVTSSSAGDGTATMDWSIGTDATATGGSPIDYFTITPSQGAPITVQETVNTYTFTGLTNGTDYTFTITATNEAALTSPVANVGPLTPVGSGTAAITSVSPAYVDRTAVATLTLTGTALNNTTAVSITCPSGTTTSASIVGTPSSTDVDVTVSAGACGSRGAVTVSATVGGSTATLASAFTMWEAPTITGVSPTSGTRLGGTSVIITGSNFLTGQTTVSFGSVTTSVTSVAADGTTLSALSPPSGTAYAAPLSVTIGAQSGLSVASGVTFTYTAPAGTISIDGEASSYPFGTAPFALSLTRSHAATVTVAALTLACSVSGTGSPFSSLTVTLSATGTCTIEVGLAADGSNSAAYDSATFSVTPGTQTVTITSTPRLTVGSTRTLTATSSVGGATITFGVTSAGGTGCQLSSSDLTATAAGTCLVTATASATNYNTATTTSAVTVVNGPAITAVSPAVMSSAGGTTVTISGSALGGGTGVGSDPLPSLQHVQVACGGASVSATSALSTASGATVSAVMPACATLGSTFLRVTTNDGSVEFPITVVQAPTIATVTPDWSLPAGGGTVTVSGTGFVTGETTVRIASGTPVAASVASGTSLTFTAPAGALGTYDLSVIIGEVVSTTSAGAFSYENVPSMPATISATPLDQQVTLSWAAATPNARSLTGYVVQQATGSAEPFVWVDLVTVSARSEVVTGLTNGTDYAFRVLGYNQVGRGTATTSAVVRPYAAAAAPTGLSAAVKAPTNNVGSGQVVITWTDGDSGGLPITSHQVQISGDNSSWSSTTPTITGTTATVSGLVNGNTYYFQVRAVTGAGPGAWSVSVGPVTPRNVTGAPAAPTLEVKTASNGVAATELKVTWALPSVTNGAAVVAYEVVVKAGGVTVGYYAGVGTTNTFTGLATGTLHSVTVAALNAAGWSAASAASTETPRDVPSAPGQPTLVEKAPSNDVAGGALRATWTAPSSTNGSAVTAYLVTAIGSSGVHTCVPTPSTALTCDLTGLTNGVTYTVTVSATNAAGISPASSSQAGIPRDVPTAPGSLQVTAKSPTNGLAGDELLFTWAEPAGNGNSVQYYVVQRSDNNTTWGTANVSMFDNGATVSGLSTGTLVYLRVSAVNAAGTSLASASVSETPRDVPGAPTGVAAEGRTPSNGVTGTQIRVSWTAPAANGSAITGYLVQQSTDGSSWATAAGSVSGTSQTVTGLAAATTYQFRVYGINGAGTSSASATVSAATRDVPTAPAAPTVEPMTPSNGVTSGSLKVTWLAPVSNGAAVTFYTATASANGQTTRTCTVAAPTLTCTISSLTNGTAYDVVVSAQNAAGTSTASSATSGTPRTVPGAPTGITLTVRNTTSQGVWNNVADNAVKVDWSAPSDTGGNAISSYTATATATGQSAMQCTTGGTTCTITGLATGVAYTVTVSATNGAGTGATGTASSTARPLAVPGAPTGAVAVRGSTRLTVTWVAPTLSARGGTTITGYVAEASPGGRTCTTTGTASCDITGLTNGTAYTVTVAAVNSAGRGADSVASSAVTPATLPSAPATVSAATASSGQLTVSWGVSAGNGAAVTSYTATSTPGGITCVTSTDSCVIGGLTNGTSYTFTVVATNAVGDSAASAASSGVAPRGLPSAPLRVVAIPTSSALVVTWEAPVDNGGSAVTGYTATAIASGQPVGTCTDVAASLTCTISGLTNQITYTVTVAATTVVGTSPASASVSATPLAPPTTQQFAAAVASATTGALGASNPTAGGTVTVTAGGFGANAWVVIGISTTPTALGAVQANGAGVVTAQVALPPSVGAGSHTLSIINPSTGTSVAQPVTVQAPTVPGAPGQPTAVAGSGTGVVDVTFTAPGSDGGATITSYTVTANPGAATCVRATAGTCSIVGLTPGTAYTFSVRANNSVGESSASTPSAAFTPKARPGAASSVTAAADLSTTGRVTVSWTAAAANGASVNYVARLVQDPSKSCSTATTTCAITGLPNYTALTVEVVASNSEGAGPASAASAAVTLVPALPASPREESGVSAGSVAATTPTAGSAVNISVTGFDPFEWVTVVVQSTPQVLNTLQANGIGTVTTTVTVPSDLAAGTHYLTVLSDVRTDGSRRGVTQSFTVSASGGGDSSGGGSSGGGSSGGGGGTASFPADRFSGTDRYSTSVEISRQNFSLGVAVVYLATGTNYADALAAGAASGGTGPVLLTQRDSLPEATRTELARLRPRRIVVLGGVAAISNTVLDAARSYATESTVRLGGADRYETAVEVSEATFATNVEVVYVATGTNFADALAAGGAARGRGPVLLVRSDAIPDTTAAELTRLRPRRIVVLGGTSAVAQSVQTALSAYTTGSVTRVGGADRYATSADLSRATFSPGVATVYVATGVNFADALSAAALGSPVLLSRASCVPASVKAELDRLGAGRVVVLGGTTALSDAVRRLTACS